MLDCFSIRGNLEMGGGGAGAERRVATKRWRDEQKVNAETDKVRQQWHFQERRIAEPEERWKHSNPPRKDFVHSIL
jgi:hypothetical protein